MWRAEGLMVPLGTGTITRQNVWHPFLQLTRSNSRERRKRKVICWACHQAFASFRCGMWNFLPRRLLTGFSCIRRGACRSQVSPTAKASLQCRGNFFLNATHTAVRKSSPLSQHLWRTRPSEQLRLVNGDFWRVDSSALNHHSRRDTFIDPLSTFTRSENQRK